MLKGSQKLNPGDSAHHSECSGRAFSKRPHIIDHEDNEMMRLYKVKNPDDDCNRACMLA
jgi:hypothetical protein